MKNPCSNSKEMRTCLVCGTLVFNLRHKLRLALAQVKTDDHAALRRTQPLAEAVTAADGRADFAAAVAGRLGETFLSVAKHWQIEPSAPWVLAVAACVKRTRAN